MNNKKILTSVRNNIEEMINLLDNLLSEVEDKIESYDWYNELLEFDKDSYENIREKLCEAHFELDRFI